MSKKKKEWVERETLASSQGIQRLLRREEITQQLIDKDVTITDKEYISAFMGTEEAGLIPLLWEETENVKKDISEMLSYLYREYGFDRVYDEVLGEEIQEKSPSIVTRIKCVLPTVKKKIEDISNLDCNKIIAFDGVVSHATATKGLASKGHYICPACGNIQDITFPEYSFKIPKVYCPNKNCRSEMYAEQIETTNFQEISIVQPTETLKNPDTVPKPITVFFNNSTGVYSGRVRITGIVKPFNQHKSSKNDGIFDLVVYATHIEQMDVDEEVNISPQDEKDIIMLSKNPDIINILSQRLIPEIMGYDLMKKAIFLQQIKGVRKDEKRADSHILIITDPGIGKSVMLRKISQLPNCVYGSATTASGAGLTAAVTKEPTGLGETTLVIRAGLLVKATGGTACVDELTVNRDILSYVLEAMESQTVHVNKAGFNTVLETRCAVLAACNPKNDRFDDKIAISEQINIPPALLSRFDLIFPLRDIDDKTRDEMIGRHIIQVHRSKLNKKKKGNSDGGGNKFAQLDSIIVDGVLVDHAFIKKYISYCSKLEPEISDEAETLMAVTYGKLRKGRKITARQLEAMVRFSEAFAKARLHDTVTLDDATDGVNLVYDSLRLVAYDEKTGDIDVDKMWGISKKDKSDLWALKEIVKELELNSDENNAFEEGLVHINDIIEKATEKGISNIKEHLKSLCNQMELENPVDNYYRTNR